MPTLNSEDQNNPHINKSLAIRLVSQDYPPSTPAKVIAAAVKKHYGHDVALNVVSSVRSATKRKRMAGIFRKNHNQAKEEGMIMATETTVNSQSTSRMCRSLTYGERRVIEKWLRKHRDTHKELGATYEEIAIEYGAAHDVEISPSSICTIMKAIGFESVGRKKKKKKVKLAQEPVQTPNPEPAVTKLEPKSEPALTPTPKSASAVAISGPDGKGSATGANALVPTPADKHIRSLMRRLDAAELLNTDLAGRLNRQEKLMDLIMSKLGVNRQTGQRQFPIFDEYEQPADAPVVNGHKGN